jgi:hypothetical protein
MKMTTIVITNTIMETIVSRVIQRISELLPLSHGLSKLYQNIRINALNLLGKTIDATKIDLFVERIVKGYIDSLPKRGETVGILAAQSLIQPITQDLLKAQHYAGKKGTGDDTTLIKLNSLTIDPCIVSLHMKDVTKIEEWIKDNEYSTFGEVLTVSYGNCKYVPSEKHPAFPTFENSCSLYINVPKTCDTFYTFKIDPLKLKEINITPLELFDIIFTYTCFGLIIHPIQTFTFELCPSNIINDNDNSNNTSVISKFNEKIQELLKVGIKGIKGVTSIDIKTIEASDVIRFSSYDNERNITRLYVAPELLPFYPLNEIEKLFGTSLRRSKLSSNEPLHLIVNAEITATRLSEIINGATYRYIAVKGIDLTTIRKLPDYFELFRDDYTITNNPTEMREFLGITIAQTIHEYNYYVSLKAKKFSLAYPHIQMLCAKIFTGTALRPITPQGFEGMEGVNPLDKLSYQYYTKHLSVEPLRTEVHYPVRGLITSTILGAKFRYGTNYARFEIDEDAKKRTIELCSIAKTEQYYQSNSTRTDAVTTGRGGSRWEGIDFYGIGRVMHVTSGLSASLNMRESSDVPF